MALTALRYALDLKTVHSLHALYRRGGAPEILQEAADIIRKSEFFDLIGGHPECQDLARDLYDTYRDFGNVCGLDGYSLRNDHKKWSTLEADTLSFLRSEDRYSWEEMADILGRTPRAVRWKLTGSDPGQSSNDLYSQRFITSTFDQIAEELEDLTASERALLTVALNRRERLEKNLTQTVEGMQAFHEHCASLAAEVAEGDHLDDTAKDDDTTGEDAALVEEPCEEPTEKNTCEEALEHESITTMTEAVEPVKKGIWAQITRSVGKQATRIGITAGGAAITTLVLQTTVKGCLKAGLDKEFVENPIFQVILKMGIPTTLRAVAKRVPVLQGVGVFDQMMESSQHVALGQATRGVMNQVLDLAEGAVRGLLASGDDEDDEDDEVEGASEETSEA